MIMEDDSIFTVHAYVLAHARQVEGAQTLAIPQVTFQCDYYLQRIFLNFNHKSHHYQNEAKFQITDSLMIQMNRLVHNNNKSLKSNISFTNTPGNHIHCIYSTETLIDTMENVYEDMQESGIENLCRKKGVTSTETQPLLH